MRRLPALFVSHGAPGFALDPGLAGPQLTALGRELPRPAVVFLVSPHWMSREPTVMTTARPRKVLYRAVDKRGKTVDFLL